MLKPPAAIKKPASIKEVFKKGKKVLENPFSLIFFPNKSTEILVVISKKQGGAVERNRTKRLIKEFFRLNEQKIVKGKYVIIPRAPLLINYQEVSTIMNRLLTKVVR